MIGIASGGVDQQGQAAIVANPVDLELRLFVGLQGAARRRGDVGAEGALCWAGAKLAVAATISATVAAQDSQRI